MAKRVSRDVVHNVVRQPASRKGAGPNNGRRRGQDATIGRGRAPSYLVCRRSVYFFQVRPPKVLAAFQLQLDPIRVRLGVLTRREAQRRAQTLGALAHDLFHHWRLYMEAQTEETGGEIGFEPGASHEEFMANMLAHLREAAARLENAPPSRPTPSDRRTQAAFQEILSIEGEIKKGEAGNALVIERADLLRNDVWDRWRAGEGIARAGADPLTHAISKLADVADRQLSLMTSVGTTATIHQPPASAAPAVDRLIIAEAPRDPPAAEPAQVVSTAPLFSQLMEEYLAMRADAGAEPGAISTMRLRAQIFMEVMGNRPLDCYLPKDLQDYVNLLQYLPLEYTRDGDNHEMLVQMSPKDAILKNKALRCWDTLSIKTMQDGYVQVVKTIVSEALGNYRLPDPFGGRGIRWPDNAKPSVKREALDYEKLNVAFRLGVESGYLDDAMLCPLQFLSSRRGGILPWIRGIDIDQKHGVDIVRVNGIVFDKANNMYRRVPYKTTESLQFFVLHNWFREIGFTPWAQEQGENFLFRQLQTCKDPSDTASKRVNSGLKRAGARGMNIEVGHSIRHGAKDYMIDEGVDTEATHLQMGHETGDAHSGYGKRYELRRKQCQELAKLPLPPEIDWTIFEGLDFEAMAAKPRKGGRPKKK